MTTAVLVHGTWHGGWCWRRVSQILSAQGWTVFTPTLTGAGERSHLVSPLVGLTTHVEDILRLVENEELDDFVLCGHSAAGLVITGVADRIPERIRHLVYIDAIVPRNNQSLLDALGDDEGLPAGMRAEVSERGVGWLIPPGLITAEGFGVTDPDDAEWVNRRLTPHPLRALDDRLSVSGAVDRVKRQTYARCEQFPLSALDRFCDEFDADPEKQAVRWNLGHDVMITHPQLVVDLLSTF